jgi:lipoyl(octanoyl) transferase
MAQDISTGPGEIEWRCSDAPVAYEAAVAEMERRIAAIRAGTAPELAWLLEHPPLYTAGTSARAEELLDPARLPVYRSGRGGQYTYHGPGQRIAYIMLDLDRPHLGQNRRDVRCHVWRLEEWIIAALARFNVKGERREGRVGVWVVGRDGTEDKIAADNYRGIVPCGIREHGVTSLARLGITASMPEIDTALRATFDAAFGTAPACAASPLGS